MPITCRPYPVTRQRRALDVGGQPARQRHMERRLRDGRAGQRTAHQVPDGGGRLQPRVRGHRHRLRHGRPVRVAATEARILKVRAGTPGLFVVRHYLNETGSIVLVQVSVYPGERFSYAMRHRDNREATGD